MPESIIYTFFCRHCHKGISPAFIASMPWAKPENGFLCENCIVKEQDNLHRLQAAATEFNQKEKYIHLDGVAPPCAVCDTIYGDERVIEDYEGEKAFMCVPCANRYLVANRDKIRRTKLEWELKLR